MFSRGAVWTIPSHRAEMGDENHKGSLLILDDEAPICSLISKWLTREGYRCRTCQDPLEALSQMAKETFDLAISDLRMPGMSGLEFLEEARRRHPRTAFLIVTGEEDIRAGVQAMQSGAADYLVKPLQMDVLASAVERALAAKRTELEFETYRQALEAKVHVRSQQLDAAMRRIEMTYDETLEALGAALDLRDTETAGHSKRVSRYCLELASAMGQPKDELKHIVRGSYLHDIGKIGIPDAILLKEGKLTAEEMQVMQEHVRIGYELVSRIAFLAPAAAIVLTHQEKWDGTGYPQGLIGEEIPPGARIFAVADTLDAMTTDRPYRKALPFAAAREEMIRHSGKQFDPGVVQTFCSLPEGIWENIRLKWDGHRGPVHIPESPGTPPVDRSTPSQATSNNPRRGIL